MICAELSIVKWFVQNYPQVRDLCTTIHSYLICAELSIVAWFVQNYPQLRDLCRTIHSYVICAGLSIVTWFAQNYPELRDLCGTIRSCVICAELSTVTWFVANYRANQPSSFCFLTTQHNTTHHNTTLHNTTQHVLVDTLLMFLELQASLVQSHLQASERVPCSNTSNITLEYRERERERNSVLCDNVVFDIDARHSATPCILTFK